MESIRIIYAVVSIIEKIHEFSNVMPGRCSKAHSRPRCDGVEIVSFRRPLGAPLCCDGLCSRRGFCYLLLTLIIRHCQLLFDEIGGILHSTIHTICVGASQVRL